MRSKQMIVAAIAAVLATGAIAVAQNGGGPPGDPGAPGEENSAFGKCVSEASEAGIEEPDAFCREQGITPPGEENGEGDPGDGGQGDAGGRFEELCGELSKEDGSFGECVAEHASAFGRCVEANAQAGVANPAAACEELRPDQGAQGNGPNGPPEGTPSGPPEGTPSGPPEGTPNGPPEGTPSGPPR